MLLENYCNFAYQFKSDKDVNSALIQPDSIKIMFDLSDKKSSERTVARDNHSHLIITGGEEVIASEITFIKFIKSIIKIGQNSINH